MKELNEIVNDFLALRAKTKNYYHTTNMNGIAQHRLEMSYELALLSDHLADLQSDVSVAKNEQILSYKALRDEKVSCTDADKYSRLKTSEAIIETEHNLTRVKQLISGGKEILNALSSKLKTLEQEVKNQV